MVEKFISKWEQERKMGFFRYYIRHVWGMAFIFFGMNIGDYLANKKLSYIFITVSLIVSFLFPVFAWIINQICFKKYHLKHDEKQI